MSTTTAPSPDLDDTVDLDDPLVHRICGVCFPWAIFAPPGTPARDGAVALCGTELSGHARTGGHATGPLCTVCEDLAVGPAPCRRGCYR